MTVWSVTVIPFKWEPCLLAGFLFLGLCYLGCAFVGGGRVLNANYRQMRLEDQLAIRCMVLRPGTHVMHSRFYEPTLEATFFGNSESVMKLA